MSILERHSHGSCSFDGRGVLQYGMAWPAQLFTWLGYGQYQVAPSKGAAGATIPLLIDGYGRLVTVANSAGAAPNTDSTMWTSSGGLATSGSISSTPATLLRIQATAVSECYLQIFNQATPPDLGTPPTTVVAMPAGTISLRTDRVFTSGVQWGASSTLATFTPISDNVWLDAELA